MKFADIVFFQGCQRYSELLIVVDFFLYKSVLDDLTKNTVTNYLHPGNRKKTQKLTTKSIAKSIDSKRSTLVKASSSLMLFKLVAQYSSSSQTFSFKTKG